MPSPIVQKIVMACALYRFRESHPRLTQPECTKLNEHSFTSVRLLNIEQPIRHGQEYDNDSALVFTLIFSSLKEASPYIRLKSALRFHFVNALSAIYNIGVYMVLCLWNHRQFRARY